MHLGVKADFFRGAFGAAVRSKGFRMVSGCQRSNPRGASGAAVLSQIATSIQGVRKILPPSFSDDALSPGTASPTETIDLDEVLVTGENTSIWGLQQRGMLLTASG